MGVIYEVAPTLRCLTKKRYFDVIARTSVLATSG